MNKPTYHTKIYPLHEVKELREKVIALFGGKAWLKHLKLKSVKPYQFSYFLRTGRDTHNGRIMIYLSKLIADSTKKKETYMYNATIQLSDFKLAEIANRLELRYSNKRFISPLYRELNERGYTCTYMTVWRLFREYRDTSGGKLMSEIENILES